MSITGRLAYFVERKPSDLAVTVRGLFAVALVTKVEGGVTVYPRPYHTVRVRNGRAEFDWRAIERSDPYDCKWLGPVDSVDKVIAIAQSKVYTRVSVRSPRAKALFEAIRRDIPPAISDNATVSDITIIIGSCDWAEESPVGNPPECIYYGRSEIALSLFGYGSPADPAKYREMIFQIPEFIQLQRDIEGVLGPVKRCIYWDF